MSETSIVAREVEQFGAHAGTWWEDCVRSRATAIHYLGIMPPALFKQPPSEADRAHAIRFALGAGCDPTLHAAFEARFGFCSAAVLSAAAASTVSSTPSSFFFAISLLTPR